MRIVVFELDAWEKTFFEKFSSAYDVRFVEESLTADNVEAYADTDILSPFIYSTLSDEVLGRMVDLKLISTRSTGYDHIDIDYCTSRGITVSNVPSYGECPVAEHVFALLLAVAHRIVGAVDRTRRGDFSLQGLQGFDLCGRTMGVVGTGNIGRRVMEIARGFGMQVVAFDLKPDTKFAESIGARYVSMDELLSTADVITLHVPGTPATENMISDRQFAMMKKGVVLINTSRGGVINVRSLLNALSDGKVMAAGLDVLPEEPAIREEAELIKSLFQKRYSLEDLMANHILLRLRNVIVTPHSAFYTREAIEVIMDTTIGNIESFMNGEPRNVVRPTGKKA